MTHNRIPGALRPLLGLLVVGLVATGCTFATAKAAEMGVGCDQFAAQKSITHPDSAARGPEGHAERPSLSTKPARTWSNESI